LDLLWQRREDNQSADDLTNEVFSSFNLDLRITFELSDLSWVLLPKLYKEAKEMHDELQHKKADNPPRVNTQGHAKKRKKKRIGLKTSDPW
jgi:hypothetical protein